MSGVNVRKREEETLIRAVPADRLTPSGLARKLGAVALLESSSFKRGKERYSIMLVDRAFMLSQEGEAVFFHDKAGRRRIRGGRLVREEGRVREGGRDILDMIEYFADQHAPLGQDLPFPAGGIGFLSYEFARRCDAFAFAERPDPLGLPEAAFLFAHVVLVFDHYTDLLYLVGLNYREQRIDLAAALDSVERRIKDMDFNYLGEDETIYRVELLERAGERERFMRGVESVKSEIVAGNLLQGVLSRRRSYRTELPSLEAYRRLRRVNPSPYMFHLDFGAYQLFGASPEMHVRVKDGRAWIKPIAGTRRRAGDAEADRRLEAELAADAKERAEHLMLVDLARNDLGRFCEIGSVEVESFMEVERFSHVLHLVSEVSGRVRPGIRGSEVVRLSFPAGTVSGAPKIRAVGVIDGLEEEPRGFYAGLVGYFEPGGGLDTCITIRSALKKDGVLHLQAGAGIVYDSVAEREYQETNDKLAALMRAAGLEEAV